MKDKIVLVTGGTRGIGSAICKKFLQLGAQVIAADINEEQNQQWLSAQKSADFENVDAVACNVADFDSCQKMVADIKQKYGKIDILVNNAGITRDSTLKKMDKDKWDAVLTVNLDSVFNVTKPVLDVMLESGYGRIVNMSSVNGLRGEFGQTNYTAAKAGMHGFTKSLAKEVAKKGITVNSVSPGFINTEMTKAIPEEIRNKIVAQIPTGRMGQPEEVAHLVAFLAAEESAYITGVNITINGGVYMY
jgi:acetoacetyl-CoA reductase